MTRRQIVNELARNKVVEVMVCNIARADINADLQDLAQMVYLILLEYEEDKILDLYENDQIRYFIARIIMNQYKSSTSPFYKLFKERQHRSREIGECEYCLEDEV